MRPHGYSTARTFVRANKHPLLHLRQIDRHYPFAIVHRRSKVILSSRAPGTHTRDAATTAGRADSTRYNIATYNYVYHIIILLLFQTIWRRVGCSAEQCSTRFAWFSFDVPLPSVTHAALQSSPRDRTAMVKHSPKNQCVLPSRACRK